MSSPAFSVIIPVHNRAAVIRNTLESVQNQSFRDFECIVIDDGSSDGGELQAVVESLNDYRFLYVRQPNGGACKARNTGVRLAKGHFVAFLDSDDIFLNEKLGQQYTILASGDEKTVVYSQLIVDRGLEKRWVKPTRGPAAGETIAEYLMCTQGWIQSSTIALSSTLARTVAWDETLPSSQDTDFAVRLASAGADFVFMTAPLVILNDVFDPDRVSKQGKYKPLLEWIDKMRGIHVSEKAYWAYRGWQCARVASYSDRWTGVKLYLNSVWRGVYRPVQALRIGAQVVLPRSAYQRIIDKVVATFGKKLLPPSQTRN